MNLIQVDSENNILKINDKAKLQRNAILILIILNFLNAALYLLRLDKEEFNFLYGVWVAIIVLAIITLFSMTIITYSNSISINEINSYSHKEGIWSANRNITLHLTNKKKRYIKIETKTQLEEIENILIELNIPKNVKIKKNND